MIGHVIAAFGLRLVGIVRDQIGHFELSVLMVLGVALIMLAVTPFLQP